MQQSSLSILLLIILCLAISQTSCQDELCPSSEIVAPCSCKNVAYGMNVVCANIHDPQILYSTFRRLSEHRLDSLLLHGINISGSIPDDIFKNMKVDSLQIERSHLEFAGPAFHGLENTLWQLKVMRCSAIRLFEIVRLPKLREFYLTGSKRQVIGKVWLNNKTPDLRILNLDSNEIADVEDKAFAQMRDLVEISMSDNRISSVTRSMFPLPAPTLTRIDLSHNTLNDLPTDIFQRMPSLQHVILSGNELTTLVLDTWLEVWDQLQSVYLVENSIICDAKIQWIKQRSKPPLFEGMCVEPEAMAGKTLKEALSTSS